MKRLPLLFLCLMLLLTACGGASKRGEAAGRRFLAVWGDTAAMRQAVQRFNALRDDSLRWPWEVKAANRAFAAPLLADGRDSALAQRTGPTQGPSNDRITDETGV